MKGLEMVRLNELVEITSLSFADSSTLLPVQTISIRSRHGLITSALVSDPPDDADLWSAASELCEVLEGDRYGSLEKTREYVEGSSQGSYRDSMRRVLEWLEREM